MLVTFSPFNMIPVDGEPKYRRPDQPVIVMVNGAVLCVIPTSFTRANGMSFPWFVRMTWDDPWHPRYVGPSLLHDYLLWLLEQGTPLVVCGRAPKKREIDWLFEGALYSQGVSSMETWIFVNAVRTRRG